MAQKQNFYSNPAFCQKSEFYSQQCSPRNHTVSPERTRALSPERYNAERFGAPSNPSRHVSRDQTRTLSPNRVRVVSSEKNRSISSDRSRAMSPERRHPPIGAQKSTDNYPEVEPKPRTLPRKLIRNYGDEQYEEMSVDEGYFHKDRQNDDIGYTYQEDGRSKGRYAVIEPEETYVDEPPKTRYEYIPMQENMKTHKVINRETEIVETSSGRNHRYAVIPSDDSPQKTGCIGDKEPKRQSRYVESSSRTQYEEGSRPHRYEEIPQEHKYKQQRYISEERRIEQKMRYPQERYIIHNERQNRYEYIPDDGFQDENTTPRKGNPEATQKLHELLITPQKFQKKIITPKSDPFTMKNTSPPKKTPKAQQKLNYTLSTRQNFGDKRQNTAVIAPICSSPVQSVYSETTFSNKTESWMNLSLQKQPTQATLAVAAVMMILCGGVSSGLCFYMVSIVGRMYYLDFGIISGFACLLLGCLGFRSRNCHWLPNRNYISGYIVLSAFSLLTCAGLLVLLFLQPKPGSPLADVTSGAVCGISGLSLILASTGVMASYCCKYPPPDNRVQHCARGFTV